MFIVINMQGKIDGLKTAVKYIPNAIIRTRNKGSKFVDETGNIDFKKYI